MKSFLKYTILTGFLLAASSSAHSWEAPSTEYAQHDSFTKTLWVTAFAVTAYCGYKGINYAIAALKKYWAQRKIDETVDAIIVGLMPHSALKKFPPQQQEKILRKKAHLIALRKRIMKQLASDNEIIAALSADHQAAVASQVSTAKLVFDVMDIWRKENPYEQEYENPSLIDGVIEASIIDSFILSTKPSHECSQEERDKQQDQKEQKEKIKEKLKDKIEYAAWRALISSDLFFAILIS